MTNYLDQLQFCINSEGFDELTKNGSIGAIRTNLNELENKIHNWEIIHGQKSFNKFLHTSVAKIQVETFNKSFFLILGLNKKIADMYRDKGEEEMANKINEEIKSIKNRVAEAIDKRLDKLKHQ